jgi:hypothetical protein
MTPSKSLFFYLCYFGIIGVVIAQIAAKPAQQPEPAQQIQPVEQTSSSVMGIAQQLLIQAQAK